MSLCPRLPGWSWMEGVEQTCVSVKGSGLSCVPAPCARVTVAGQATGRAREGQLGQETCNPRLPHPGCFPGSWGRVLAGADGVFCSPGGELPALALQ